MAHETVPADIAAAIDKLVYLTEAAMVHAGDTGDREARAALDAAILKHLRNADEMKAALERIEQGA